MPTWDAGQYLRFGDERTRPCRELVARIAVQEPRRVIDLGCGPGNSTAVLAERWPGAAVIGLDNSAEMIAAARKSEPGRDWRIEDIAAWADEHGEKFDVILSNAALQWVPDHAVIFAKLFNRVAPGGALAIQVPANDDAPAHRIMRELAASPPWRDRLPPGSVRQWFIHDLTLYYDALAPVAANLDMWVTEYQHILPNAEAIIDWYKGSGLRPFLEALPDDRLREQFTAECLARFRGAYPPRADGRVIFPFRRLFMIAYKANP